LSILAQSKKISYLDAVEVVHSSQPSKGAQREPELLNHASQTGWNSKISGSLETKPSPLKKMFQATRNRFVGCQKSALEIGMNVMSGKTVMVPRLLIVRVTHG
jgi:hypothetical protein